MQSNNNLSKIQNHIDKVCQYDTIKKYTLAFFEKLCSRYSDKMFRKEDFETISFNGKEVEQDVARDLFVDRDSVSASEVFAYLFENNIDRIAYLNYDSDLGGEVDFVNKELYIKMVSPYKFYQEKKLPAGKGASEIEEAKTRKELKQYKAFALSQASKEAEKEEQHILNHELSHILSIRSFAKRKLVKINTSDYVKVNTKGKKYVGCSGYDITNEKVLVEQENHKSLFTLENYKQIDPARIMTFLRAKGGNSISEILHEAFVKKIEGVSEVVEQNNDARLSNKQALEEENFYNDYYDVAQLIKLATREQDEIDIIFNPKQFINKLNNLNVSKETMSEVNGKFYSLIKEITKEKDLQDYPNYQFIKKLIGGKESSLANEFSSSDIYTKLAVLLGSATILKIENKKDRYIEDFKILAQEILLEGISNNIINELEDQSVEKNVMFFKEVNDALNIIGDNLLYPDRRTLTWYSEEEIKHLLIKFYAEKEKDHTYFKAFSKLIDRIDAEVQKQEATLPNISKVMTFLEQQKQREQSLETLEKEEEKRCKQKEAEIIKRHLEKQQREKMENEERSPE